ncbi:MAG TPA: hypothetical protein VEG62_09505 [Acidimicrobiales bacterium]|nr:hypothetical protein [Acidimicrobiales bacterium]
MPTTSHAETAKSAHEAEVAKPQHRQSRNGHTTTTGGGNGAYVVPMVHVSLPESAVNIGFWSVLVGSVVLGAVDFPLAALIGAGVLIAKHRRSA